jgi:hypothetical protein
MDRRKERGAADDAAASRAVGAEEMPQARESAA